MLKMTSLPSEEDFAAWLDLPVTQAYRLFLLYWIEDLKAQWAAGMFMMDERDNMIIKNAAALAKVNVLEQIETLSYEELVGGLERDAE